jgi:hypothetical protein
VDGLFEQIMMEDGESVPYCTKLTLLNHILGSIPPSPACKRALMMVAAALRKQGHEVVELYV